MEVHRNLRTPKPAPGRMRMVRVVGDGTPPNTRILDGSGEQIPELVTSYSIQGDAEGCARGVFIYLETDEDGELVMDQQTGEFLEDTFEAWVVLERPHELNSAANQIARLAQFIMSHVPDEPSEDEGAVDTAIRLLRNLVEVPVEGERYWFCKIGPAPHDVPNGGDSPMRRAVDEAFFQMFGGKYSKVLQSGWGAHLTQGEREANESYDNGDSAGPPMTLGEACEAMDVEKIQRDSDAEESDGIRSGGGGWEAELTEEDRERLADPAARCLPPLEPVAVQTAPAGESDEAAFSRLAPGRTEPPFPRFGPDGEDR